MIPTPSSDTARVERKRNRIPLSCGFCRRRKLKCTRTAPCENCIRRKAPHSCTYMTRDTRSKTAADEMHSLEELVLSLMFEVAAEQGAGAGTDSGYDDEVVTAIRRRDDFSHHQHSEEQEQEHALGDKGEECYYPTDAHCAVILAEFNESSERYEMGMEDPNFLQVPHFQYTQQQEQMVQAPGFYQQNVQPDWNVLMHRMSSKQTHG